MNLILSVLLFVFRFFFLFGIETANPLGQASNSNEAKISIEITDNNIHALPLEESKTEFILIEIEEEEKTESEHLPLLYFAETAIHWVCKKNYSNWETTFYTSKPKMEGLYLYDLFHSWKSFLA